MDRDDGRLRASQAEKSLKSEPAEDGRATVPYLGLFTSCIDAEGWFFIETVIPQTAARRFV